MTSSSLEDIGRIFRPITEFAKKGQTSRKTLQINLCTSKTGYSEIYCSYLPLARFPSFCIIHAHTKESCICKPCCYCGMQKSGGVHGWLHRESVGDRAVSHPGNSIVDRKIETTIVRLGRCFHYYGPCIPDSAVSFSFRRQRWDETKQHELLYEKYYYMITRDRHIE